MTILNEVVLLTGPEKFLPGSFRKIKTLFQPFVSQFDKNIITIGGTNGKGETSHYLNRLLIDQNESTAMWTSPHVFNYNERFCFNGKTASNRDLSTALSVFKEMYQENTVGLSFYELSFWIFCYLAKEKKVKYLILEVGLGGRLDAVNIFDADISLVNSISRDHVDILGNSYEKILIEKLAISRKGKKLFASFKLDYLNQIVEKYTNEHEVNLMKVNYLFLTNYRLKNLETAIHIFNCVSKNKIIISPVAILNIFKTYSNINTPGRMQSLYWKDNKITLNGAHNLDGHRHFIALMRELTFMDNILIIGFSRRPLKELIDILKLYQQDGRIIKEIWVLNFTHQKAINLNEIKYLDRLFEDNTTKIIKDYKMLKGLMISSSCKEFIITGSYYLLGDIRREFSDISCSSFDHCP